MLHEAGLLYNRRLHQLVATIPGVTFWDWESSMTVLKYFSHKDYLHPSREGNERLHTLTAERVQKLLSPDRDVGLEL